MKVEATLKLNVPWGYIAAKTWGNSKDTKVLLVHGILDNAGSFDRLIKLLPEAFYYVAIDLPGHGFSSKFESGVVLNFLNYVLAIRYVLEELKWDTTYFIGHSLGAQLGLFFSIIYPERIKKLILIDGIAARSVENINVISRIQDMFNNTIESQNVKPPLYSIEQVMYGLKNLRSCSLNTKAAETLLERAFVKSSISDNFVQYTRDYRIKSSLNPLLTKEQILYLIKQHTVNTLIILCNHSLQHLNEQNTELIDVLKNFDFVTVVNVKGNHDVHNNYPERISDYVAKFLCTTASKL